MGHSSTVEISAAGSCGYLNLPKFKKQLDKIHRRKMHEELVGFFFTQRYKSSIRNPRRGLLGVGHTPVAVSPCVCPVLLLFPWHLLLASVTDRRWDQHNLPCDPAQLILYPSIRKCPRNKLGRDLYTFCRSGGECLSGKKVICTSTLEEKP